MRRWTIGIVASLGIAAGAAWAGGVDSDNRLEVSIFGRGRAPLVSDAGAMSVTGTITVAPPAVQAIQGVDGGYPVTVSGPIKVEQDATSTPWIVSGAVTATSTVSGTVAVSSVATPVQVEQDATSTPWIVSGAVTAQNTTSTPLYVDTSDHAAFAEALVTCGTSTPTALPVMSGRRNATGQAQTGDSRIALAPTNTLGFHTAAGSTFTSATEAAFKCQSESTTATSTVFWFESK
jgi:hypothetical protein